MLAGVGRSVADRLQVGCKELSINNFVLVSIRLSSHLRHKVTKKSGEKVVCRRAQSSSAKLFLNGDSAAKVIGGKWQTSREWLSF
jgi:hypothetical protein